MRNPEKPARAPAPDGTLGHDARSASQRTRLGAGMGGFADSADQHERGEQTLLYSLHDAVEEYGFPVPIEAIYRANTDSPEQLGALWGDTKRSIPERTIIAPPLVEHIAETASPSLPTPCLEWAEDVMSGMPSWIWLRSTSVEVAMAIALLALRKAEVNGRVGRLSNFVALCRQAPLYGEYSRESIVHAWAQEHALALAVSVREQLDVFTLEVFLSLLHRRYDSLLPTIIAADASGAQILNGGNRSRKEALICEELVRVLGIGISGFLFTDSKTSHTVDLAEQANWTSKEKRDKTNCNPK